MANLRIVVVATAISSVFAESRGGRCGAAQGPCGDVSDDDASGGPCCSQYGWCGSTVAFCGPGCNPMYGDCTGSSATTSPRPSPSPSPSRAAASPSASPTRAGASPSSSPTRVLTSPSPSASSSPAGGGPIYSTDYRCGPSAGGTTCPMAFGCCSLYAWCGATAEHCGTGCQSLYSSLPCTGVTPSPSRTPSRSPIPSASSSFVPSASTSRIPSASSSPIPSASASPIPSASPSAGASQSGTPTRSPAPSQSNSVPPSQSRSPTASRSPTPSRTASPTPTRSPVPTATSVPGRVIAPGTTVYECSVPGTVAITFDDGPYLYTQAILDMINAAGMKVTFFMNGNNWDCIYNYWQLVRAIDAAGHQIASHTFSHPDLSTITQAQVSSEMTTLSPLFSQIIGKVPIFMRPPFGSFTPTVINTLKSLGFVIAMWTQDSGDSVGASFAQEKNNYNGLGTIQAGATIPYNNGNQFIFLNHDVQAQTANQLVAWVINWVQQKGLRSVTVAQCLGVSQPYRDFTTPYTAAQLNALVDKCPTRPVYA